MAPAASAQVVSYDNSDGTFVWTPTYWLGSTLALNERNLDLTLSAADNQASLAESFRSFSITSNTPGTSSQILFEYLSADRFPSHVGVAQGDFIQLGNEWDFMAKVYSIGEQVAPSDDYESGAAIWAHSFSFVNPLLGDEATVGVRFPTDTSGTSFHYGYIKLVWQQEVPFIASDGTPFTLSLYQPVAWAYETTPDTPITIPNDTCLADTNGDGAVTPADFSAWVAAFNAMAPECDQNEDGSCTPADFSAWVANFNAGC